ncbi:MAG: hypothetical protein JOZ77_08210 [Candidatus Eremiobacteraeota bacterium]|nr:hypothetical protein [Candidatus Eremiobacteraeota bacterium]
MVAAACPKCTIYMIEGANCGAVVCGLENAEVTAVNLVRRLLATVGNATPLHVISSGSDGSCGNEYLCEAGAPHRTTADLFRSGRMGSPNGQGLFSSRKSGT